MTVETFTQSEFEEVLSGAQLQYEDAGIQNNEYTYRIFVNDNSSISIRSSIKSNGISADVGKDSIRLWAQIKTPYGDSYKWTSGKKVDGYIQRTPGWQDRMLSKIAQLSKKCNQVKVAVGYCPECHKAMFAAFSSSAKNPDRPYASCRVNSHKSFTWLDVDVAEKKEKKETVGVLSSDAPVATGEKLSFLDKGSTAMPPQAPRINSKPAVEYAPNEDQAKAIFAPINKALRVLAPPGSGKCLAPGTKIIMFDGSTKKVEDVIVGDLLMGVDSTPRIVLSLAHGYEEMFDIIPTKGEKYTVNKSHILSLVVSGNNYSIRQKNPLMGGDGTIINLSISDYLSLAKHRKHHLKGWRTGVEFPKQDVLIDPYFVGLWLGDGHNREASITTTDSEILEYLHLFSKKYNLVVKQNNFDDIVYHLVKPTRFGKRNNLLLDDMRKLNLINNKYIPENYKINNKENRMKLLAGLLDADGHQAGGYYEIVQKKENLADDIVFVARSLGFAAYKKEKVINKESYWRVTISGNVSEIPVLVKRKKAKPRKQKKNVLRTGISVKFIGHGEYYGFTIDGDHLFLLEDFTVTHNTWLLEQRIKHLVGEGVNPRNILYVTFSKDMADSGLARILATNPDLADTEIVNQICTIHALCFRIYKEENNGVVNVLKDWQLKKEITVLSEGDERKKVRGLWEDSNKRPGWKEIASWINLAKSSCLEGNDIQKFYHQHLGAYHGERMTKMFSKLQVIFKRMRALTFNDMLYEVELMLIHKPNVLAKYQARFEHVIVDEAQDTSAQAMRILTNLAKPQDQFCVVGDTDQMLYRFAGATPEDNLYDGFEQRYPDATTVKLAINYRSTRNIIETCNKLIRHNYSDLGGPYEQRYLKDVEARLDAPDGSPVTFSSYVNPEDEANNIVREISMKIDSSKNVPGDFFVGTRTRAQLGYLEGYLIRANVPFINIAGGSFWNLKHVSDIIAYLSVANDETDKMSFAKIYNISSNYMNVPWSNSEHYGQYCSHRFLGKAFLDSCYGSYKYINNARSRKSFVPGIEDLVNLITEIRAEISAGSVADTLQFIVDYCYAKWLAADEGLVNDDESENGKLEDLQTVIDVAHEYKTVSEFLKFVQNAREADEAKKNKDWSDYVVISTIHRLKGLEREIVFGAGLSEGSVASANSGSETPSGLLPHTFSLTLPPQNGILPTGGMSKIEDERDIAFVLVSRAKSECHLSGVQGYRKAKMHPSRFVEEMGLLS